MIVAWDFDGVLNAGTRDGRFLWTEGLKTAWGIRPDELAGLFRDWDPVMTGREDILDRLAAWLERQGHDVGAAELLAWWLEADTFPDAEMRDHMDRLAARGVRQVIATNNEPRRAAHIEGPMGYGARVERVFASGRMGLRKPQAAFFHAVTAALGAAPAEMLLVDDLAHNIEAARALGWQAFHLTPASRADLGKALDDARVRAHPAHMENP